MNEVDSLDEFCRLVKILATHAPDGFPVEGFNTFSECQLAACKCWLNAMGSFEHSVRKHEKIDKKFMQGLIILDVYRIQIELGITLDPAQREKGRTLLREVNDMLSPKNTKSAKIKTQASPKN
jgi:hypothetical protein